MKRLLVVALLFAATSLSASPNSQADFLHAYVRSLILAGEANRQFESLPHYDTGSPEQLTAFRGASSAARATLTRAIDEIAPFSASVNRYIAESAKLMQSALETRRALCDGWTAAYQEMAKPDADGAALTQRITALRADIEKSGATLGDAAIAAVRGVINIDSRGKPQQWAVTWNERRAAVKELQTAFGNDISKGPRAGQNYVQTAAALFARFLSEPGFNFLPSTGNPRPR